MGKYNLVVKDPAINLKEVQSILSYQLKYVDIENVIVENDAIVIFYEESKINTKELERIEAAFEQAVLEVKNQPTENFYENSTAKNSVNCMESLLAEQDIVIFEKGLVAFGGQFLKLYRDLDNLVIKWALELSAKEYQYPDLISLDTLQQFNYLSEFPQHLMLTAPLKQEQELLENYSNGIKHTEDFSSFSKESMSQPKLVNKLAVCPHVYKQYEGKRLDETQPVVITTVGKCKRYEHKAFNYFERLLDFSMREIVIIGTTEDVLRIREQLLEKVSRLIERLAVSAKIVVASDPFFTAEYSRMKLLQQKFQLKYELLLPLEKNHEFSVASFNYHGDHFSKSFNIRSKKGEFLTTGCIAFGLERFIYGLLEQNRYLREIK